MFAIRDQHEQAREHFRRAWEMRLELLGEDHPDTADALYRVADSQVSMGELDAAEETYLRVLDRYRTIYGDRHPRTAWLLHSIGILKWRQKKTSHLHRTTLTTPSRGKSGPDISTPSVAQIFVLAKFSHD